MVLCQQNGTVAHVVSRSYWTLVLVIFKDNVGLNVHSFLFFVLFSKTELVWMLENCVTKSSYSSIFLYSVFRRPECVLVNAQQISRSETCRINKTHFAREITCEASVCSQILMLAPVCNRKVNRTSRNVHMNEVQFISLFWHYIGAFSAPYTHTCHFWASNKISIFASVYVPLSLPLFFSVYCNLFLCDLAAGVCHWNRCNQGHCEYIFMGMHYL